MTDARRLTLDECGDTLSVREVCAVLGVSPRTWRRWRQDHDTPIAALEMGPGSRPRYAKAHVARYLASPRHQTPRQRWLQAAS